MFENRSKVAFASAVLGVAYTLYLIIYFYSGDSVLAAAMVTPHIMAVLLASIFNVVGFYYNKKWGLITACVLYSVAVILFTLYFIFLIPMIVLRAIGISKVPGKDK